MMQFNPFIHSTFFTQKVHCPYSLYCWKGDKCTDVTQYTKEPECYMPADVCFPKESKETDNANTISKK